jgi:hypothetical protein
VAHLKSSPSRARCPRRAPPLSTLVSLILLTSLQPARSPQNGGGLYAAWHTILTLDHVHILGCSAMLGGVRRSRASSANGTYRRRLLAPSPSLSPLLLTPLSVLLARKQDGGGIHVSGSNSELAMHRSTITKCRADGVRCTPLREARRACATKPVPLITLHSSSCSPASVRNNSPMSLWLVLFLTLHSLPRSLARHRVAEAWTHSLARISCSLIQPSRSAERGCGMPPSKSLTSRPRSHRLSPSSCV